MILVLIACRRMFYEKKLEGLKERGVFLENLSRERNFPYELCSR